MQTVITGRHLEITAAAHSQIAKKLGRIDRLLHDSAVSAQCIVSHERGVYVFDLTVHARADHMLHAVGRNARLATAVVQATDRVAQQAHVRLECARRRLRSAGRRSPCLSRNRILQRKIQAYQQRRDL